MIPLCDKELSDTLVGLYDDYQCGFDIGEKLKLCVDLALLLELELSVHRLGEADAVLEAEVAEVLAECEGSDRDEDKTNRVIYMDFGGGK
ncbi:MULTISPECIES: hypothetical protein [unclassified Bartonella]|uniref:hypothetical protein n=1 Tax=unclassified Bartonella TaxID=2645622 RepID=UPI00235F4F4E|nr:MULTISPECIES: hypothetical protein [unclassified Bartonella]